MSLFQTLIILLFSTALFLPTATRAATPDQIKQWLKSESKSVFACYQPISKPRKRICISLDHVIRSNSYRAIAISLAIADVIAKKVGTSAQLSDINGILTSRGIHVGCEQSRFGPASAFLTTDPGIPSISLGNVPRLRSSTLPARSTLSLQPFHCGGLVTNKSPSDSSGTDALLGTLGAVFDAEQDAESFDKSLLTGSLACVSEDMSRARTGRRQPNIGATMMAGASSTPDSDPPPDPPPDPQPDPAPSTSGDDDTVTVDIQYSDGTTARYVLRDQPRSQTKQKIKVFVGKVWKKVNDVIGNTNVNSDVSTTGGSAVGVRGDCIDQDSCPAVQSCMSKATQDAFNQILIANNYDGCNANVTPTPGADDVCYQAKIVANYDEGLTDGIMKAVCELRGQFVYTGRYKCVSAPRQMNQDQNICKDPRAMCLDSQAGPSLQRTGLQVFRTGKLPVFEFDPPSTFGNSATSITISTR